jgi:hypothetical protein
MCNQDSFSTQTPEGAMSSSPTETIKLPDRDNDPARPAPEETFQDRRTLNIGGERIELAWHGSNHSPDNIYIHLPDHDTLTLIDSLGQPEEVANDRAQFE